MSAARSRTLPFRQRAFVAVALTLGFYLLALGIAGILLYFPWSPWARSELRKGVSAWHVLECTVTASLILWSIRPRFGTPPPPGPRLVAKSQPRLFAVLRSVAADAGERMPDLVYLTLEPNAGVTHWGGFLGSGGKRTMVLGLSLLAVLRVSEFRAVLAHEFGHFKGGETRLGPWIYRTREAIFRTIGTLSAHGVLLEAPFAWYGRTFLRMTTAISRRQELEADRLAARVAGAPAVAGGIRRIASVSPHFEPYVKKEVSPVINGGFRPPLAEGFRRFLRSRAAAGAVEPPAWRRSRGWNAEEFDTHPPLDERLAELGDPAPEEPGPGNPNALTLLEDVDGLEEELLRRWVKGPPERLEPISWDDAGAMLYVPSWRTAALQGFDILGETTVGGIAARLAPSALPAAGRRAKEARDREELARAEFHGFTACALAVLLFDRGWTLTCEPGHPIVMSRDGQRIHPFEEVAALLVEGKVAEWEARARSLGIDRLLLRDAAAGAS